MQTRCQSVTHRYREFPVPGFFHFFGGIGTGIGTNWYRKKVSEPVSEKFGTGADFFCQHFGIRNISNGYRNRYREFVIFSGGTGTGIGKICYRKKSRNRYRKYLVQEKGIGIV